MRDNVGAQVAMGALNAVLGTALGWAWGGYGVALGWCLARCVGSVYVAAAYARREQLVLGGLVGREGAVLIVANVLAIVAAGGLNWKAIDAGWSWIAQAVAVVLVYALLTILPLWRHPTRIVMARWLTGLTTAVVDGG